MSIGRVPGATGIQPSIVDAKGDLIVATAADSVDRLAVGSNGQVLTADSSTATGLKWAGGGKVLQVVSATHSTAVTSSSTTYVDTGLTATITPSATTSKILVLAVQNGIAIASGNQYNQMRLQLLRTSTVINSIPYGFWTNESLAKSGAPHVLTALDSPSTTSATTYKTQFSNGTAAASVSVQDGNATSTIYLIEVGA